MRLIHTADWHLGRIFHGVHLTEDQAYALDQLIDLVRKTKVEAVLVSGDIYDRAVPPPEAVALLDDIVSRLILECKVSVVIIAGNHDSPDRLGFASRLLASQGLHVVGSLPSKPVSITLRDRHGPVCIYALPYAEPPVVRERLGLDDISDHDSAMRSLVDQVRKTHPDGTRSILMAHAFIGGGEESESERPLTVGGAGAINISSFQGFHYVALGHLHRPQKAGDGRIHYSGSLLKYSFSESSHAKSVNLVDMDEKGNCKIERIPLTTQRDVRCVEGYMDDILKGPIKGENKEDYLMVTLHNKGAILDAMGKLRNVYPNVLHIERTYLTTGGELRGKPVDHKKMTEEELFASFFQEVTKEEISEEESSAFSSIVNSMRQREREVPE